MHHFYHTFFIIYTFLYLAKVTGTLAFLPILYAYLKCSSCLSHIIKCFVKYFYSLMRFILLRKNVFNFMCYSNRLKCHYLLNSIKSNTITKYIHMF